MLRVSEPPVLELASNESRPFVIAEPNAIVGRTAEGRSSWSLSRKLGAAFAALALMLAAIGVIVALQVSFILQSSRRVIEEQRESSYSRELVRTLRSMKEHLALRSTDASDGSLPRWTVLRELQGDALDALAVLELGPAGEDPSEAEHVKTEIELFRSLRGQLVALGNELQSAEDPAQIQDDLDRVIGTAKGIHEEMRDEALRSGQALRDRGEHMRLEVAALAVAGFAVLLGVTLVVRRSILRPIRELQVGAERFGRGDLSHRVVVGSRDEVGALAREFNRMAGEIETMRTGLEQRVRDRTREFVRAARLAGLGTLAAGVAHEINNPLASIASCAEGLDRRLQGGGVSLDEQREYLQIIAKEAYRAHEITSRLLEFARQAPGERAPFSVQELLRETDVLLRARLAKRGLALDVECASDLPPVMGNASECKQVVMNLIGNAIDASPQGGRIRVACRRAAKDVVLEVEDQGHGVPAEDLERIFDPFFTTKAPGAGTGLGLAIVARIVEDHGGRVEVENTGRGACFRVIVPAAEAHPV